MPPEEVRLAILALVCLATILAFASIVLLALGTQESLHWIRSLPQKAVNETTFHRKSRHQRRMGLFCLGSALFAVLWAAVLLYNSSQ